MSIVLDQGPRLKTGLRWPARLGVLSAFVFLGGTFAWASLTEISGAVIANGVIEVEGKPKSVQHLDGGVVEHILVSDGQFVERGAVLIQLDDTLLKANIEIYKSRLSEAMATRDRLLAEQSDRADIAFDLSDPLLTDVDTAIHIAGQREVFEARRDLEAGRKEQLREKIRQFHNQTAGVNGLVAAKQAQQDLLDQELASMSALSQKGLAKASQLLALQRQQADLLGQISEHQSELARIQNSIRDTELEILQGQRQMKEAVVSELREVTTNIQELRQQIISTQKQLDRVALRAPNAGRIHEMQITTIGGVVPPGGTIMQIVPVDEDLGFRTRVDPSAVDQIYVGQAAKLRFPAFNQRTTPELNGSVADISPTSVVDEATGASFFWVRVTAPDEELARLGGLELVPGMPVEAFLQTTDRTVLSYLTKPMTDQLNEAFREE